MTESVEEFLAHFGVKGQKWGVRREIARGDKAFEKGAGHPELRKMLYDQGLKAAVREDLPRINSKPEYINAAKKNELRPGTAIDDKYSRELRDALMQRIANAAGLVGTNASGTKHYVVRVYDDDTWDITTQNIEHADDVFYVRLGRDESGMIVTMALVDDLASLSQSISLDRFFLSHGLRPFKEEVK